MFNRETAEDGKELFFDHGAPYFTVTDNGVMDLVHDWETRGFVAEWKESFGSFDCATAKFVDFDKVSHDITLSSCLYFLIVQY